MKMFPRLSLQTLLIGLGIFWVTGPAAAQSPVEVPAGQRIFKTTGKSGNVIYFAKTLLDYPEAFDLRWDTQVATYKNQAIYTVTLNEGCEGSSTYRMLSIVGPYASFKGSSGGYCEGAAHPSAFQWIGARNLKTGKKASLTEIFAASDLYQALLGDGVIKKALKDERPANLDELLDATEGGCKYYIGKHILSAFAFHHVKGDKVAVRIGLSHGCEVMRGNFGQLGIYLPIPAKLQKALREAERGGTLMKQMGKLKY